MIDMERRIDKCKKAIETTKKAANLAAFLFLLLTDVPAAILAAEPRAWITHKIVITGVCVPANNFPRQGISSNPLQHKKQVRAARTCSVFLR
jgi:hypothetical protein